MGDDARIWAALDSLVHPPAAAPADGTEIYGDELARMRSASSHPVSDATQRGVGSQRALLPPGLVDALTGLYDPAAWSRVMASESARWTRFRRPCQVVQVEVVGIASIASRLGRTSAEHLLLLLTTLLREESREFDLYGRSSSWRIQGILPEQESSGGACYSDRIRTGFGRRVGPGLPLGLIIGTAAPTPDGSLSAAFLAAEQAMHRDRRPRAAAVPGLPVPDPGRRAESVDIHASLLALRRLREDGLISEDELLAKRSEMLGRL
jgi:GGDEF domain-containing protein